jgi:hypothetical protein
LMSPGEDQVLAIFRFYRMSPYQMLCLDRATQTSLAKPLDRLIERGWLVREDRHGGFHLTSDGFAVVRSSSDEDEEKRRPAPRRRPLPR